MIELVRIAATYGNEGTVIPPKLVIKRVSIGSNLSEEDASFYRQHPHVLGWIQKNASELNLLFEFEQVYKLNENSLNENSLNINSLPTIKSALPTTTSAVVSIEQFNWRKVAVVVLLLTALVGLYQKPSIEKISAHIGYSAVEFADFKQDLELVKETDSSSRVQPNPYFKQNATSSESFVLVSGVFSKEENARKWMNFLSSKGIESAIIPGPSGLIRVCSLPIPTDFEAVHLMDEWRKNHGIHAWILPI